MTTTEAGKRLQDFLDKSFSEPVITPATYRAMRPFLGIATIEAEAVAAERARIRAAVEGLDDRGDHEFGWKSAVLAIVAPRP